MSMYTVYPHYPDAYGRWSLKKAKEAVEKKVEKVKEKSQQRQTDRQDEREVRRAESAATRAVTGQNRFDYWLTQLGSGKRRAAREARTTSEYTFYVDPTEYETTTDPETGITTTKSGIQVFKGDPLYFDYYSEIAQYKNRYGIPSTWRTLGDHWNHVQMPVVGVKKELMENTAVRQYWIPTAENSNVLAKLYSMNAQQKAFAQSQLNYAKAGVKAVDIVKKVLDVAANSPIGMLLKIFSWQTETIEGVFLAQIEEVDIENALIKRTLEARGLDIQELLSYLIEAAKNEDWELYTTSDYLAPPQSPTPPTLYPITITTPRGRGGTSQLPAYLPPPPAPIIPPPVIPQVPTPSNPDYGARKRGFQQYLPVIGGVIGIGLLVYMVAQKMD